MSEYNLKTKKKNNEILKSKKSVKVQSNKNKKWQLKIERENFQKYKIKYGSYILKK